jgi:N-acyl-D-amino-acid deacylase
MFIARMLTIFIFIALLSPSFSIGASSNLDGDYDLVITNGRIVDGTGNPWFKGSVAIKDGKIVKVGTFQISGAKKVIDAQNNIVAPGFIDVHAHVEDIFNNPKAENFIRMGVTSLVTGNCGGSATDVREFLGRFDNTPLSLNLGTLIAHGSVRSRVLGLDNVTPSREQQDEMNSMVRKGMEDGALGLSTGLIYLPGTFAKTEEVVELAKVAGQMGGVYASHIRDEGLGVVEAVKEAINIGEQADIPVDISHFKISAKKLWGNSDTTIGLVEDARRRGLTVTVDQYAYTASSTSLDVRLPNWVVAGGRDAGRARLADPATRKKVIEEMIKSLRDREFDDFSFAYVASYRTNPAFNGKNIAEITEIVRGTRDLNEQIEQVLDMYIAGGAQMVYMVMSETDIKNIMRQPFTMIASDSGVREFGAGVPHPRGYGNNARVLGRYVREMNIITLEDAIRKMTSLPAQTFNLRDRGLIKEGFAADVVIFDEKTVIDKATFENPHQYAEGFSTVIVNGKVVFDGGSMTGVMSGSPLYGAGRRTR